LDAVPGETGFDGGARDDFGKDAVGAVGVGPPAEDDRVARLQAEGGGIDGDVRPRLVHDKDHSERHAHLLDLQTFRRFPPCHHLAHRIGQGRYVSQTAGDAAETPFIQEKAVDKGGRQPVPASLSHIVGILDEDLLSAPLDGLGHGQ